jgi:hypothetical protein
LAKQKPFQGSPRTGAVFEATLSEKIAPGRRASFLKTMKGRKSFSIIKCQKKHREQDVYILFPVGKDNIFEYGLLKG